MPFASVTGAGSGGDSKWVRVRVCLARCGRGIGRRWGI